MSAKKGALALLAGDELRVLARLAAEMSAEPIQGRGFFWEYKEGCPKGRPEPLFVWSCPGGYVICGSVSAEQPEKVQAQGAVRLELWTDGDTDLVLPRYVHVDVLARDAEPDAWQCAAYASRYALLQRLADSEHERLKGSQVRHALRGVDFGLFDDDDQRLFDDDFGREGT